MPWATGISLVRRRIERASVLDSKITIRDLSAAAKWSYRSSGSKLHQTGMTCSIDSRPLASLVSSVEFKVAIHVASGTGLVEGVGSETVAQLLQHLTLPNFEQARSKDIADGQIHQSVHGRYATASHDSPIRQNDWPIPQVDTRFGTTIDSSQLHDRWQRFALQPPVRRCIGPGEIQQWVEG